jgi:hypothetical protein
MIDICLADPRITGCKLRLTYTALPRMTELKDTLARDKQNTLLEEASLTLDMVQRDVAMTPALISTFKILPVDRYEDPYTVDHSHTQRGRTVPQDQVGLYPAQPPACLLVVR